LVDLISQDGGHATICKNAYKVISMTGSSMDSRRSCKSLVQKASSTHSAVRINTRHSKTDSHQASTVPYGVTAIGTTASRPQKTILFSSLPIISRGCYEILRS